ncbi:hypothetical protein HA075_21825 [bacterium BFN5]|nr:hypothetical protein HA075_21825 [bacterium BFN5]
MIDFKVKGCQHRDKLDIARRKRGHLLQSSLATVLSINTTKTRGITHMKKRLLAAAVAASMTLSVGVAMAAPVEFDGSAEVHYQWDTADNAPDQEAARNTVIVNAKTALDEHVDVYARFAAQRYHGADISADFDTSKGKSTATIDRYGFILKSDSGTYTFGRQGGTTGLTMYTYLLALSGFTGAVAWISICWSQYNFRRSLLESGTEGQLKFRTPFFPYVTLFGIWSQIICLIVVAFTADLRSSLYVGLPMLILPIIWFKLRSYYRSTVSENVE